MMGEESYSRTRKDRFTLLDCFDMSYGTVACIVKEVAKFYLYYIRGVHVHKVRVAATQESLAENLCGGQSLEEAIKLAGEAGNASARRASLQAKHIMVPGITCGWDLFETIYVGGTLAEGVARGIGAFVGAYSGGVVGEGDLGWLGFVVGSRMGAWIGGRIGLMAYDVGSGVQYLSVAMKQRGGALTQFVNHLVKLRL